jgi:hypothetical protein
MFKKILNWLSGASKDDAPLAPYKVEPPQEEASWPVDAVEKAPEAVVDSAKNAVAKHKRKATAMKASTKENWPFPTINPESAATTTAIEVKAKFKKAELAKMSKAELLTIAKEAGLDIKARTTKDELVKVILKG